MANCSGVGVNRTGGGGVAGAVCAANRQKAGQTTSTSGNNANLLHTIDRNTDKGNLISRPLPGVRRNRPKNIHLLPSRQGKTLTSMRRSCPGGLPISCLQLPNESTQAPPDFADELHEPLEKGLLACLGNAISPSPASSPSRSASFAASASCWGSTPFSHSGTSPANPWM